MTLRRKLHIWIGITAAAALVAAAMIAWVDQPVAVLFKDNMSRVDALSRGLSSTVLITIEIAMMAVLAIVRIVRGEIPPLARIVLIACCVSLCTFAVNDHVLKLIFGRPNPSDVLMGQIPPGFQFFQGSFRSSFPSGHMAMACSFGMVVMRGSPRFTPWLEGLLALAAATLVVGDWHFVSDVIAGTFAGCLAGFWAWELWTLHMRHWAGSGESR